MKHKQEENISFYIILYGLFKQKAEGRIYIDFQSVREIMRRRLHKIPRCFHYVFLKEMEFHNLIKRIGSRNGKNIKFELVGGDIDKCLNQFSLPV